MPQGIVVPWDEMKRRSIADALNRCGGNSGFAAQLLGIGKTSVYRLARACNHQPSLSIILFCPLRITSDLPLRQESLG